MLIKTHLAITGFFALLLFPFVEDKLVFLSIAFISTYLPDIDSRFSSLGHRFFSRILQFFTNHRGLIHSFSFLFLATIFFVLFFPVLSLGFFTGYASHLFADSFTRDGIQPFYPSKKILKGFLVTGSIFEKGIFVIFFILDILLLWLISVNMI